MRVDWCFASGCVLDCCSLGLIVVGTLGLAVLLYVVGWKGFSSWCG